MTQNHGLTQEKRSFIERDDYLQPHQHFTMSARSKASPRRVLSETGVTPSSESETLAAHFRDQRVTITRLLFIRNSSFKLVELYFPNGSIVIICQRDCDTRARRAVNDREVDQITLDVFYKPHTVSLLVCCIVGITCIAFFRHEYASPDYRSNVFAGLCRDDRELKPPSSFLEKPLNISK